MDDSGSDTEAQYGAVDDVKDGVSVGEYQLGRRKQITFVDLDNREQ